MIVYLTVVHLFALNKSKGAVCPGGRRGERLWEHFESLYLSESTAWHVLQRRGNARGDDDGRGVLKFLKVSAGLRIMIAVHFYA